MASTGFQFAGTGANNPWSGTPWVDPENITADDNSYAKTPEENNGTSDSLRATNFGFSIPSGSTIDGYEVRYKRYEDATALSPDNAYLKLYAGGSVGTADNDTSEWATSEETITKGSDSDLWGTSLTAAQVNASTFGVELYIHWSSGSPGVDQFAYCDSVEINVHYTPGTGCGLPLRGAS